MLTAIAALISSDPHRFRENHTVDWLKWHLDYAFHQYDPCKLFAVEKDGRMCAFYMTKRKFYEQASSRGFANLWLGSIVEWGTASTFAGMKPWIVVRAALEMRKCCDAVEVVTLDKSILRLLRLTGFVHVGDSNFRITAGAESPLRQHEGWDDLENWRLRPAMCDNAIG